MLLPCRPAQKCYTASAAFAAIRLPLWASAHAVVSTCLLQAAWCQGQRSPTLLARAWAAAGRGPCGLPSRLQPCRSENERAGRPAASPACRRAPPLPQSRRWTRCASGAGRRRLLATSPSPSAALPSQARRVLAPGAICCVSPTRRPAPAHKRTRQPPLCSGPHSARVFKIFPPPCLPPPPRAGARVFKIIPPPRCLRPLAARYSALDA